MSATHLGLINTASPGRTIEVTDNSGITHVIPKTMTTSEALDPASHPFMGSMVTILGNTLSLRGYSIALREGDLAEVSYRYGNAVQNSDPTNPGAGIIFPGVSGSPITDFYDLDSTLESLSIVRHPRYQTLASNDLRVLGMMIQLGPLDADGNARREGLSGTQRAEECANKIEAGTISYLAPKYIWRYRKLGGSWSAPYALGKIGTPVGPAPNIVGNWLYMGAAATGWQGGAFETTYTWESSPAGDEWDNDLYS